MVDNEREETTLGYAMAVCTYTRKDSPYFWFQWRSSNHRRNESSGVRLNDPDADLKLAKRINKTEARLLLHHSDAGWDWGQVVFLTVYKNSSDTLRIHLNAWNWLQAYLRERAIAAPDALTRQHLFDYVNWRTAQRKAAQRRLTSSTNHPGSAIRSMQIVGQRCMTSL